MVVPPIYANLFSVTGGPEVFQIQFKNQVGPKSPTDDVAHIVVSPDNARQLAEALTQVVADVASGNVVKPKGH